MTDADKAPYVQLAVQDKLRYEAEMAEYRAYATANAAAASAARPALPGASCGRSLSGVVMTSCLLVLQWARALLVGCTLRPALRPGLASVVSCTA